MPRRDLGLALFAAVPMAARADDALAPSPPLQEYFDNSFSRVDQTQADSRTG
jgi:hypothetical protein